MRYVRCTLFLLYIGLIVKVMFSAKTKAWSYLKDADITPEVVIPNMKCKSLLKQPHRV